MSEEGTVPLRLVFPTVVFLEMRCQSEEASVAPTGGTIVLPVPSHSFPSSLASCFFLKREHVGNGNRPVNHFRRS